jgi:DNA helicase-2/ATP-dependent DNA helicase PcrA
MNLSSTQRKIVNHIDGALLVMAGPGSGKTRVLTERIKSLLATNKRGRILALTFSNMAADEMRLRLEHDTQLENFSERVNVSTIHSFCLDLLQSRGHLIGLRADISLFEKEDDRITVLRDLIFSEPTFLNQLTNQVDSKDFISNYLSKISEHKRKFILPEESKLNEPFPSIYRKYNEMLAIQNAIDYDDILFFSYLILIENINVTKIYNSVYRYICVDEAQDLNEAQYRVIQALCCNGYNNIMMVGDPNQSIYAFNGSSSKYMSKYFLQDFSPTIYKLDKNFRSAKQIIKYANSLIGDTTEISHYFYDGELSIDSYKDEKHEAQSVRAKIEQLTNCGHKDIEGKLTYDKFSVIARNKYVLSSVESELYDANIPCYYRRSLSGISSETDIMKIFDNILRLLVNPFDLIHRRLLCNLTNHEIIYYVTDENIYKFIEQILAESNFAWLSSAIKDITPDSILNFNQILHTLEDNIPTTLSDDDKNLLLKDIEEWKTHWTIFQKRVPNENRTLIKFRNAIALGKTQRNDTNTGVVLLTAHMSKGLEFEVVFIIGLSDGTFPDYRAIRSGDDAINQEKNNMYVAVTRAKRLCYLSFPKILTMPWGGLKPQQPSRFISSNFHHEIQLI